MDKFLAHGIVLERSQSGESDLVLSILCRERGKLRVLAKGARASKKRFMGGVDIFDCALFGFSTARQTTSLYFLDSLSERQIWLGLRANLLRFSAAAFAAEVINHFTPEGDMEAKYLFLPLRSSLSAIDVATCTEEITSTLVFLLLVLLKIAGVDPLEADLNIDHEILSWWQAMLHSGIPHQVSHKSYYSKSMRILTDYVHTIIGKKLRTIDELARQLNLQNLSQPLLLQSAYGNDRQ